ncbi:ATP-binding protein [Streptomyces sp. NPDC049970]|uniref:ATP-binding protein n=1 Tax=Streptomyces sp. NPDC049970 TaxID=3155033 RepID=UPI003443E465
MTQEITRTEHSAPARQFTVLLSPTRRGARLARLLTTAHLSHWGLPTESAAHIVAELATNATVHGRVPGRDFRLSLTVLREALLRIEVTDARGERVPPAPRSADLPRDEAESGRGLPIVGALADRWGVDVGPAPRKTVWAELDLAP